MVTQCVRDWVEKRVKRRKMLKAMRQQRLQVHFRARREKQLRDMGYVRAIIAECKRARRGQPSPWKHCHVAVRG